MAFTLITFQSCDKDFNDAPFEVPPTPIEQTITQGFNVKIQTGTSQMTGKSWNPTTWEYNYSTIPAILTLTGTDNPNTYTKSCTVAELLSGSVSITMLPGKYRITYETPHIQSSDPWSKNNYPYLDDMVGDVLDIKIDQTSTVEGTPIPLNATLQDALIVVDVPNTTKVARYSALVNRDSRVASTLLLKNIPTIHYGYVNSASWLIMTIDGTEKNLDLPDIMNGNAYHIISSFGATTSLIIPNMVVNTVVVD